MSSHFFSQSAPGLAAKSTTTADSSVPERHHLSYGMITPQYSPDTTVAITLRHFEKEAKAQAEAEYDAENGELPPPPPDDDPTIDPSVRLAHKKRRKVRSAIVSRRKTAIYAEKVEVELNHRDSVNLTLSKNLNVYKEVITDIRNKIDAMQRSVDERPLKKPRIDSDLLNQTDRFPQAPPPNLPTFPHAPVLDRPRVYEDQPLYHAQGSYPLSLSTLPVTSCQFDGAEMEADLDVSDDDPTNELIGNRHQPQHPDLLPVPTLGMISSGIACGFTTNRMVNLSGEQLLTAAVTSTTDDTKLDDETVSVLDNAGNNSNSDAQQQAETFFFGHSQTGRTIANPIDSISLEEIDDVGTAVSLIGEDTTTTTTTTLTCPSTTVTTNSGINANHCLGIECITSTTIDDDDRCDVIYNKQFVEATLSECSDRNMSPAAREWSDGTTNEYDTNQSQVIDQALEFMVLPQATSTQWKDSFQPYHEFV